MRIKILRQIDELTETHCKPCTLVDHSNATAGYQQKLRQHCYGSCKVGAKLRELGDQLTTERQQRRKKSGKPVEGKGENDLAPEVKRVWAKRPGQKKRPNPISKSELEQMLESGMTLAEIERAKGLQMNTLSQWAKKWGLSTKPREDGEVKITKEQYLAERAKGKSRADIAKEYGMSNGNLYYWLGKWGVRDAVDEEKAVDALRPPKPKTIAEAAAEAAREIGAAMVSKMAPEPTAEPEPTTPKIDWLRADTIKIQNEPGVWISAKGFAFDSATAVDISIKPGDRMLIGYADGRLYFRRDDSGMKLQKHGKYGARVQSDRLPKWPHWSKIAKRRYPVTVQDGMIVAEVGGE